MANDRRGDARGAPGDRELLSAADVTRTIARIAHQIIEKTAGDSPPVLIGIPTRGAVLARRLSAAIGEFSGSAPDVGAVDATLHRDDLRRRPTRAL
ncbi:MAG: bifunctional pyr operon transcriptional regulator/uracil phosphoribosyltransferase PyrR, partial [Pseudonocardia sp.]|nr:bifunctional pyr operon transcriptional regulator/uracil phosphoribosyltransferase PyrR [Pseudonocardia sp.]